MEERTRLFTDREILLNDFKAGKDIVKICSTINLSTKFIERNINIIINYPDRDSLLNVILEKQHLRELTMRLLLRYFNKTHWENVSRWQVFSEDFFFEFCNNIDFTRIEYRWYSAPKLLWAKRENRSERLRLYLEMQ